MSREARRLGLVSLASARRRAWPSLEALVRTILELAPKASDPDAVVMGALIEYREALETEHKRAVYEAERMTIESTIIRVRGAIDTIPKTPAR